MKFQPQGSDKSSVFYAGFYCIAFSVHLVGSFLTIGLVKSCLHAFCLYFAYFVLVNQFYLVYFVN